MLHFRVLPREKFYSISVDCGTCIYVKLFPEFVECLYLLRILLLNQCMHISHARMRNKNFTLDVLEMVQMDFLWQLSLQPRRNGVVDKCVAE